MTSLRDSTPPVHPDHAARRAAELAQAADGFAPAGDDPTDYTPDFHPTAEDERAAAESNPLNRDGDRVCPPRDHYASGDDFDFAADDSPPTLDEWHYFDLSDLSDDASGAWLGHGD